MKIFKIILLCIIPILGIYGMNKIQLGQKLVIMLPGQAPVRRPGGPPGPPPQMEQEGPQAMVSDGEHGANPGQETEQGESPASMVEGEQIRQGPPASPQEEEQSKWKVRINFNRGIKNMGFLTLIMAFFVELTYISDRLIRRKPLL